MRIGIMLRAYEERGGVGVYTRNVTRNLLESAPQHEFYLYFDSPGAARAFTSYQNAHIRVLRRGNKAVWDQIRIPLWFRRDRLDVLFHPKFTVPLACAKRSVMVLHGAGWFIPEVRHFWSRRTRLYARLMMPLYCRAAGAVLSVSEITRQVFVERLRVPPEKIVTVYFAPGPQFRTPLQPDRSEAIRARYDLPPRYILTLSGGDRAERKNFATILDAFRRVHEVEPCSLVVAGRGCEDFRERFAIPATGWGRDVLFTGWVEQEELPVLYRCADVFLYPSKMEAFPIPITEALATRTPIVTSNAFGLRELAGDAAMLVDPSDPAQIASAVVRILSEPELREELRTRARQRSELFDWRRCARETLAVLERVGG